MTERGVVTDDPRRRADGDSRRPAAADPETDDLEDDPELAAYYRELAEVNEVITSLYRCW
jgi:hypothetical protein